MIRNLYQILKYKSAVTCPDSTIFPSHNYTLYILFREAKFKMPTALIIGAGSRIGHATATAFAGAGYKVAVASRTAKLQDISAITHFVFDAAKPETVRELFESVRKIVGIPSVVIYNGIFSPPFSPF
jgi:hypothetical protein